MKPARLFDVAPGLHIWLSSTVLLLSRENDEFGDPTLFRTSTAHSTGGGLMRKLIFPGT